MVDFNGMRKELVQDFNRVVSILDGIKNDITKCDKEDLLQAINNLRSDIWGFMCVELSEDADCMFWKKVMLRDLDWTTGEDEE